MLPSPWRVAARRRELADTFTLELAPQRGTAAFDFAPGQFNMLYVFGVGEVPISISGDAACGPLIHTVRSVGGVTEAMGRLGKGDGIGLRGPFGRPWPMREAEGNDVVIVTGGIGLAPLRPAILHLLANRQRYGNICIFYGARSPGDILYRRQLERWRGRLDLKVEVTVDHAGSDWAGPVSVVTKLITGGFDPHHTIALVCGPEIMMRYAIASLNEHGVDDDQIYVSMERNMKCAVGFCGHCQLGGSFVCKDGPVFRFDTIAERFAVREL